MKRMTTDDVRNDASGGPIGNVTRMLNYAYAEGGRVKLLYAGGTEEADLYDYVSQSAKQYTDCAIYPCDVQDGACLECDCPVAILNIVAIQAAELRARLMMIEDILGEDYDLEHLRELVKAEHRWIPVTERLPETDLTGKCGSCAFAAPAPGSFGRSTCYVRCTNKEHLQIYCRKHHSSGLRQRTVKACKRYKPKEV